MADSRWHMAKERELISDGREKRPSFVKRISFQIRLNKGTNDERGEPNDVSGQFIWLVWFILSVLLSEIK